MIGSIFVALRNRNPDPKQQRYASSAYVANRCGVTKKTVVRWCERGDVLFKQTPGGDYRIAVDDENWPIDVYEDAPAGEGE